MAIRKKNKNILLIGVVSLFLVSLMGCGKAPIPRPYGYFRIDLPPHTYTRFDSAVLPYSFEVSHTAKVRQRLADNESYWIDIIYPAFNASIYCSYKPIHHNLFELNEDTRKIVYKHTVRADAIGEKVFTNADKSVYGILYSLEGNTASQIQFVLTDSVKHFFRAALYFENTPNKDSISPVGEYIKQDMQHLMETFEWKK
ncbi:MAG: gliding motility lipoprotein GldD [Paludibacteraceae bacterium]